MWFFDGGANRALALGTPTYVGSINTTTGQITEYQTGNNARPAVYLGVPTPPSMVLGSDNAVWFADGVHFQIDRVDTSSGAITTYDVSNPANPTQMPEQLVSGPDGNIWFTSQPAGCVPALVGNINLKSGNAVQL